MWVGEVLCLLKKKKHLKARGRQKHNSLKKSYPILH